MRSLTGNRRVGRIPSLHNVVMASLYTAMLAQHLRAVVFDDADGMPAVIHHPPTTCLPDQEIFDLKAVEAQYNQAWSISWFRLSHQALVCPVDFRRGWKRLFSVDFVQEVGEKLRRVTGFCVFLETKYPDILPPAAGGKISRSLTLAASLVLSSRRLEQRDSTSLRRWSASLEKVSSEEIRSPWSSTVKLIWPSLWSTAPKDDLKMVERDFLCCSSSTVMASTVRLLLAVGVLSSLLYFALLGGIMCSPATLDTPIKVVEMVKSVCLKKIWVSIGGN